MPVYKQLLNATNNAALIAYDAERSLATGSEFKQRSALIKDLTAMKMAERNELVELLFHHARLETPYATQAAIVVATGCLSPSHLWKTLGFSNRQELYDFLNHNFPSLVELNDKNMRWKRFFYLQLCNNGGDYVCRSPSCDTCTSYNECFVTDA
jgi:nitrogen fixation protein NifQ